MGRSVGLFSIIRTDCAMLDILNTIKANVYVYGPLRVKARTIKDTKLRWKIPKNFPDEHRPSNGLYTVLPHVFIHTYFGSINSIKFLVSAIFCFKSKLDRKSVV